MRPASAPGEPEPYLPKYAFELSASELAGTWLKEWYEGIAGTGIRPGFIKTGVTPGGSLRPISEKIIRAAAHTVRRTGLAMACHTVEGTSAMRILEIFAEEDVPAHRFIYVHAQGEKRPELPSKGRRGGWMG